MRHKRHDNAAGGLDGLLSDGMAIAAVGFDLCGIPGCRCPWEGEGAIVRVEHHRLALTRVGPRQRGPGMVKPPSTSSDWPVMNRASSVQSHTTASAISSGVPTRPSAARAASGGMMSSP